MIDFLMEIGEVILMAFMMGMIWWVESRWHHPRKTEIKKRRLRNATH